MPAYKRLRSPPAMAPAVVPFRWNFDKPEQLPAAVRRAQPAEVYPHFRRDLRAAAARTLKAAGDADLLFVGRSPESLMDYLGGALAGTPHAHRIGWLNLSVKWDRIETWRIGRLRPYLHELGLHPGALGRRPRPVALVDFLYAGETFAFLLNTLYRWSIDSAADWPAAVRKLRIIGVQRSPAQHRLSGLRLPPWADRPRVQAVMVPRKFWCFCANDQQKSATSHPPARWGEPEAAHPPRRHDRLSAAKRSLWLRRWAHRPPERLRLIREFGACRALADPYLRRLALDLRGHGGRGALAPARASGTGLLGLRWTLRTLEHDPAATR